MKPSRLLVGLAASTIVVVGLAAPASSAAQNQTSGTSRLAEVGSAQKDSVRQDRVADALAAKLGKAGAGVYYQGGKLHAAVTTAK